MCRVLLPVFVIGLLGCQYQTAQTQTDRETISKTNLVLSKTTIDTPIGPVRRIEFKHANTGKLVRLEIQHLTTGRRILGETGIRVDEAGQWLLYNLADNKITARFKPSTTQANEACQPEPATKAKPVLAADFVANGTQWRSHITRIYEQPKPLPGIATESEPAVDLVVCALNIK